MTSTYHKELPDQTSHNQRETRVHQVVKAATATTMGGSLLIMSGLTLAATVITLTVATPVLLVFSPVLVPALITVFLLATGFFSSGGFGVAGVMVLVWMYRYLTADGQHTTGDQGSPDQVGWKGPARARGWDRDRDEHAVGKGHHATGGVHLTTGARTGLYNQS